MTLKGRQTMTRPWTEDETYEATTKKIEVVMTATEYKDFIAFMHEHGEWHAGTFIRRLLRDAIAH